MNTSRWVKRAAIALAAIAGTALLGGAGYEATARSRAVRNVPVRGKLVDIGGGRRIQIDCRGHGSPTVVLESGLDMYGSLAWTAVHDSIAATTRVCAYSRAGILWSDPAPGPINVGLVATDLHAALLAAGESAPWVMVGHSLGGAYVMMFTHLFDPEVAGLVLVDASHPDQFARFTEATGKSLMPTATVPRIAAAVNWTGLLRLVPPDPSPAGWPASVIETSHPFLPTSVAGLAREVEDIPGTLKAVSAYRSFGDRPLVVLSAGIATSPAEQAMMKLDASQAERLGAAKRALHDDQATWSRRGRHVVVAGATHYIQFDRPDAVIRAVRDVVTDTRR